MIDFGKDAEGRLFVVTELCAGQPLERLVAETGALPLDRTKKIVAQIGEALLEGQKVGVVHHDLAAKNVLIGADDEVKVINFVAPVPVTETVFGVPEYLSPEQAEGKLVDQRSNTYSLGAIMTLLLSGQPPLSGPDARGRSRAGTTRRARAAEPRRAGADAGDRSRRAEGDGQEPEPPPADAAAVPDRRRPRWSGWARRRPRTAAGSGSRRR